MRKNQKRNFIIGIIVVAVAIVLLGFNTFKAMLLGGSINSTRELALSCTLDMYTQFHIHPHLKIVINGKEEAIPTNLGITLDCMHPLHAHDSTGIIHVESPEVRDFTMGDLFAVWNKPFSKDQIFDFKADETHEIVMTVDGVPSDVYENLVFKDKQEIVIEYRAK